jgi:hypothetical protein
MPKLMRPNRIFFRHPGAWAAVGCLLGISLPALAQPQIYGDPDSNRFILIPPDADDWTRHFRVGGLVGLNISADFNSKGTFGISGNNPSRGIYDDGYVRHDPQSGNDGLTGYWGYNNASQYNAAAQTLQMHATSSFSTANSSTESGDVFGGFEIAYGDNYWYWKHARVGWELGFGMLPIDISNNHPMAGSVKQSTYTFNTGNIIVPGAPYQGGSSGQGPLIPASPFETTSREFSNGTITGSRTLDVNLFTIRLGPSFYWDVTDNFGVSLGAGPALGIAAGEYSFNETVTANGVSSRTSGKTDSTDVVFGGYVNATVMYHIDDFGKRADIYLSAQYMPMGDATIGSGGREARLNLGGQVYISAGINWPF